MTVPNRFNYRCPSCLQRDSIGICAAINVKVTSNGAVIDDDISNLGPEHWCSESAAGCEACGYEACAAERNRKVA
jgi:hypothetical protein